mmetsp:Transcript_7938/g.24390  ORF Transcript_7938/g.24390 Transcript_7938/m.24390 type:complete len:213 (+) Transcript_7938:1864-2502(+)
MVHGQPRRDLHVHGRGHAYRAHRVLGRRGEADHRELVHAVGDALARGPRGRYREKALVARADAAGRSRSKRRGRLARSRRRHQETTRESQTQERTIGQRAQLARAVRAEFGRQAAPRCAGAGSSDDDGAGGGEAQGATRACCGPRGNESDRKLCVYVERRQRRLRVLARHLRQARTIRESTRQGQTARDELRIGMRLRELAGRSEARAVLDD